MEHISKDGGTIVLEENLNLSIQKRLQDVIAQFIAEPDAEFRNFSETSAGMLKRIISN